MFRRGKVYSSPVMYELDNNSALLRAVKPINKANLKCKSKSSWNSDPVPDLVFV